MSATVSDAEAVRLADLNYAESYRLLGKYARGGLLREEPGLVSAVTGPVPWLNATVVYDTLAEPEAAISRSLEFYRKAGAPFVIRIRVGFEMEAQRAMQALGLQTADRVPGMVLNPVGVIPPPPPGLTIDDWSAESLPAYNEVMRVAFGAPMALMDKLQPPAILTSRLRGFVGYVDGRPVATSALIVSDGVAGVYNVATLPEYRKRGLGEAMTWHAVREGAASGCVIGSLQASAMGQPVYARMGFRNIAPYETYVPAKPDAG